MKKQILLFAFMATASIAFAQSNISYNIKAGLVHAGMKGDAINSFQNLFTFTDGAINTTEKTGLFATGSIAIPLSGNFSIVPGIGFAQKGYTLKGKLGIKGTDIIGGQSKLNLNYVDMPIMARADFGGLQVFAGPQVSYLAGASLHTTAGIFGFNFISDKRDVKDQFNELDVALSGGLGYQLKNGLQVSASYDHGLSKVNAGQNVEAYNRAFKVGIGLSF